MTKTNSKKVLAIVSMVALSGMAVLPASAMGPEEWKTKQEERRADRQEKMDARKDDMQEKRQEAFCTRFVENAEKLQTRMTERYQNLSEKRSDRSEKLGDRRESRDGNLSENRDAQDAKRAEWYKTLEEKADTDAKKAAVAEFKTTMEAAVKTRREAVDAAIAAFRSGVDSAISSKKTGTDAAGETFRKAYEAAIAEAKNACENGTDPATVRSGFNSDMKAARETLQNTRQEMEKVGEQVRKLAETKNAAIKAAMEAFQKTATAAREKLQAAFGETAEE